jgi:hypothetical protein
MMTHLWIELVHPPNGLFNPAVLDRLADLHALVDELMVDIVRQARLASKLDGSFGEALDEEILEH